jgi:N-methylhydantoinase A
VTYRISVDIGGTFTDVVVADAEGKLSISKALTTPRRAFEGINTALADVSSTLGLSVRELLTVSESFT